MSLDTYTVWIFAAGAITGIGVTIIALVVPDMIASASDLARYFRHRQNSRH